MPAKPLYTTFELLGFVAAVKDAPSAYDGTLSFTHGNVVTNNDEFNAVGLLWMASYKILLRKAKIENIACVIPWKKVRFWRVKYK